MFASCFDSTVDKHKCFSREFSYERDEQLVNSREKNCEIGDRCKKSKELISSWTIEWPLLRMYTLESWCSRGEEPFSQLILGTKLTPFGTEEKKRFWADFYAKVHSSGVSRSTVVTLLLSGMT